MSFLGSFLKVVATGALFATNFVAPGSTLAWALLIGGFAVGSAGALIDKPPKAITDPLIMEGRPKTPLPVVYGRAKVGSVVADWFLDPDVETNVLYQIVALSHGSANGRGIAKIEEIWIDNQLAITNPTRGDAAESGGNDVREHPYGLAGVDFLLFLGTPTDNIGAAALVGLAGTPSLASKAPYQVTDSGWSATTDTGKGICAISFRLKNIVAYVIAGGGPDKAREPIFHGPPSISAILQGNFVEDPRSQVSGVNITFANVGSADTITRASGNFTTDGWFAGDSVTVSGSASNNASYIIATVAATVLTLSATDALTNEGPVGGVTLKRWAHPVTGGGSNPALCIRDYLLSTIYGCGYASTLLNATSFTTAADYCDELIDYPLTAGNDNTTRLTCNGVVDTGRTTKQNLDELLTSCRGGLVWEQGQFKLVIRSEEAPAATLALTPSNLIGQWSFRNAGNEDRWNLVTATYIDPLNGEFKPAETQWPPIGTNAYLTADNSFANRLDLQLPFTNDQAMAQMIAQIILNEARNGISCQVVATEAALAVSVGDLVTVTHPTPGWAVKPFWVTALELRADTTVALTLMEYQPTAYDLATMEDRRTYAATSHVPVDSTVLLDVDYGPYDLVTNGSFAAAAQSWDLVTEGLAGSAVLESGADRYTGTYSIKLTLVTSGPPPPKPGIRQAEDGGRWILQRCQPGETLRVTGAMKVSGGITSVTCKIKFVEWDSTGGLLRVRDGPSWNQADTTWTVKASDVVVTSDAYYVSAFAGQSANSSHAGTAWVDEIHMLRTVAA